MLLIISAVVVVVVVAIVSGTRVPGGVNPAHLGWMSDRWIEDYRASHLA